MKVLFDECVPKRLRRFLAGYAITTVPEAGWAGIKNGELLAKAKNNFDVFITVDRNLFFQQNPKSLPIPVILIQAKSNKVRDLEPSIPQLVLLLNKELPPEIHRIGA